MLPTVQCVPVKMPQSRPGSWNLLARLHGLLRNRPTTLDPEQLSPHLSRDLGFSDHDLRSLPPMAPRDFWVR